MGARWLRTGNTGAAGGSRDVDGNIFRPSTTTDGARTVQGRFVEEEGILREKIGDQAGIRITQRDHRDMVTDNCETNQEDEIMGETRWLRTGNTSAAGGSRDVDGNIFKPSTTTDGARTVQGRFVEEEGILREKIEDQAGIRITQRDHMDMVTDNCETNQEDEIMGETMRDQIGLLWKQKENG